MPEPESTTPIATSVFFRKRAHEMIDRHVDAVGFLARAQPKGVVGDRHRGVRGNHEQVIRFTVMPSFTSITLISSAWQADR